VTKILRINGTRLTDVINGTGGNDKISAGRSEDTIIGGLGNDKIDGGEGVDIAVFSGRYENYLLSFARNGNLKGTVLGADGFDDLKNVEFLHFDNAIYDVANNVVHFLNRPPVVSGPVLVDVVEDGSMSVVDALANASDPDAGTVLQVVNVSASLPSGLIYDPDTLSFTFNPAGGAYQYLAADETATGTVSYGISDGQTTTPASASWTVTGSNDAPVITDEIFGEPEFGETSAELHATLLFDDVDLSDVHSVQVIPHAASGYAGTFTATIGSDSTGIGSGSVALAFTVTFAEVEALGPGQHPQTYTIEVSDGQGGIATTDVTIPLGQGGENVNHEPNLFVDASRPTDTPFGVVGDNPGAGSLIHAEGTLSFSDEDTFDHHSAFAVREPGAWGELFAFVTQDTTAGMGGVLSWHYQVETAPFVRGLGQGEFHQDSFTVFLTDNKSVVEQDVLVTINGNNDRPVNGGPASSDFLLSINTPITISGSFGFNDFDTTDLHSVRVVKEGGSAPFGDFDVTLEQGSFTTGSGGLVRWSYAVDPTDGFPGIGNESFQIIVEDQHGASDFSVIRVFYDVL
jgi:VCBS repeat-containing protein